MKQNQNTVGVFMIISLVFIWGQATTENDHDFKMCGIWLHGNVSRHLKYNLSTGCHGINISVNADTLFILGSITAKCEQSKTIPLDSNSFQNQSDFCVLWEPLLDLLTVEVNGKSHTLCSAKDIQENCCTDLSSGTQKNGSLYGIVKGNIKGDILQHNVIKQYRFYGQSVNCKKMFCDEASQRPGGPNIIEEAVMKSSMIGRVDLPCVQAAVIEMNEDFAGHNFTLPAPGNVPPNKSPLIYLPPCLNSAATKPNAKVVCTYYRGSRLRKLFKATSESTLLDDIVGISVENEVITNLPEPVRIRFHHSALPTNLSRRCVSWDTRRDNEVMWRSDGCKTVDITAEETECCCNHLTYFAILVQVKQRTTVRHLEALTYITAVGCAVSLVSCVVLFCWLWRARHSTMDKEYQFMLLDRGLVVAVFFLCLFFILSGTLLNVENKTVCQITGTLLHYSLLSALCWMAMEVFYAFILVHKVFQKKLPSWVFYVGGFGLPALVVCTLLSIGDIYGEYKIVPSDDVTNPYRMCWMLYNKNSRLAHYIINVGLVAVVMTSGVIMLFYVVRKTPNRKHFKERCWDFLSILAIAFLFGTTWGLSFLDFGPFSEVILFLFCMINSLQGFFLMLRHFVKNRRAKKNESSGVSTGTSKQPMLQTDRS